MSGCAPASKFIFPDPVNLLVESVTSEAGPCTPDVTPSEDNCGNLIPTLTGVPSDDGLLPLILSMEFGGDILESGYTITPQSSTAADGVGELGMNDPHFATSFMTPFGGELSDLPFRSTGSSVAYCSDFKTVVVSAVQRDITTPQTLRFRRHPLPDTVYDYDDWSDVTTFDPTTIGAPAVNPGTGSVTAKSAAIVEAPDGKLLCFYTWADPDDALDLNIAVLKSLDCGVTWQLLHRQINLGFIHTDRSIRTSRSGSWVKVAWLDADDEELVSVATNNSGLTFSTPIQDLAITLPVIVGQLAEDRSPWDLVGVGGGAFILVYTVAADEFTYRVAQGSDNFAAGGGGVPYTTRSLAGSPTIYGLGGVRAWGRVYLYVMTTDFAGSNFDDQLLVFFQQEEEVLARGPGEVDGSTTEWQPTEPLTGQRGVRFFPQWISLANCGGRFIQFHSSLFDEVDLDTEPGTMGFRTGVLSPKPFGEQGVPSNRGRQQAPWATQGQIQSWFESVEGVQWASPFGRPAPIGDSNVSPDTDWLQFTAGAPTVTYFKNRHKIETFGGDVAYYEFNQVATAADSWVLNGATLYAVGRIVSGSSSISASHGIRMTSRTSGGVGTDEIDIELRISTTTCTLRDIKAGADKVVVNGDYTKWTMFRLAFRDVDGTGNIVMQLMSFALDDPANTLSEIGTAGFTQSASATPEDELRWGAIAGANAGDSEWREVGIIKRRSVYEQDVVDVDEVAEGPYTFLPIPTSQQVCIGNGLGVLWGGGAGAVGDQYLVEASHLYPAENIFEQSCQLGWRSGGADPLDPQSIVLEVGANPNNRSLSRHVVLCGIEEPFVSVEWADDAAFTTNVVGPVTLDSTIFTGLVVGAINGNTIGILDQSAIRRFPISGELSGLRIRMTSGNRAGLVYCVDTHCGLDLRTRSDNKSSDLGGSTPGPILAGDTFDVFLPFAWTQAAANSIKRHFMRIRFTGSDTCTGDHRLAAFFTGCGIAVPIPLEWTHSDSQQPDVTLYEGAGGISWAYRQGPSRRLWTGRVVNDYVRWREVFRYLLERMSAYSARPMVIVPDDENPRSMIYARFDGNSTFDNSFWWNQDDGDGEYRFPGGDMQIRMLEVP